MCGPGIICGPTWESIAVSGSFVVLSNLIHVTATDVFFLTREYVKRYEQVIGDDDKFAHSLTRSLDPSLRSKHSLVIPLTSA